MKRHSQMAQRCIAAIGSVLVAVFLGCFFMPAIAEAATPSIPLWQRVSPVLAEKGESFAYLIESRSPDAPAPLIDDVPTSSWTMEGNEDGFLTFDTQGAKEGTYVYELWQVPGEEDGVVYDGYRYKVTLFLDSSQANPACVIVQVESSGLKRNSVGWTVRAEPQEPSAEPKKDKDLWHQAQKALGQFVATHTSLPATGEPADASQRVLMAQIAVAAAVTLGILFIALHRRRHETERGERP